MAAGITLTFLFSHPLAQIIIFNLSSVILLAYIIIMRPFKDGLDLIQQITFEIAILVVNIALLVVAVSDTQTESHLKLKSDVGEIIIKTNIIANYLPTGFLMIKLVLTVQEMYEKIKERRRAKITSPLTLSGAAATVRKIPVGINKNMILAQNTLNAESNGLSIYNLNDENNLERRTDFDISTNKALVARRGLELNTDNSQIGHTRNTTTNLPYQDWLLCHEGRPAQPSSIEVSPLNGPSPLSSVRFIRGEYNDGDRINRRATFAANPSSDVEVREPARLERLTRILNRLKTVKHVTAHQNIVESRVE